MIGNYIVLNIFLAILLDNFEKTTDSSDTLYAELEQSNEVMNALMAFKKTIADLFLPCRQRLAKSKALQGTIMSIHESKLARGLDKAVESAMEVIEHEPASDEDDENETKEDSSERRAASARALNSLDDLGEDDVSGSVDLEAAHTTMTSGTGRAAAQSPTPDDRRDPRVPFMEPLRQKIQVDPMSSESIAIQRRNADKKLERQLNISFAEVRAPWVRTPNFRVAQYLILGSRHAPTARATALRAIGNRAQLAPSRPPIVSRLFHRGGIVRLVARQRPRGRRAACPPHRPGRMRPCACLDY